MLTINPISFNSVQHKPITTLKSAYIGSNANKPHYCYPAIYFTGNIQNTDSGLPYKTSTLELLDNFYYRYEHQTQAISPQEITASIKNIERKTNYSEEEIKKGMQLLTQFGNFHSVNKIGKELQNNEIGMIANNAPQFRYYVEGMDYTGALSDNFGANLALNYVFDAKSFTTLSGENFGIILDNKKLNDFEKFKQESPEKYNKMINNKFFKFIVLSGFNNGINFFNRNKDLETETVKFLDKAHQNNLSLEDEIDKETLDRCKKLGIEPIIIKNENSPTEENIYKQLKPDTITKDELKAVIDATVMDMNIKPDEKLECKDGLVKYVNTMMDIYTPEKLSSDLQILHTKIEDRVKELGKTMDDVVYLIPENDKSYDYINYMFQQVNNIPEDKFLNYCSEYDFIEDYDLDNKVIVVVDDCSLSGNSINENLSIAEIQRSLKNTNLIFAFLYSSEAAKTNIGDGLLIQKRQKKDSVVSVNTVDKYWDSDIVDNHQKTLTELALGYMGHCKDAYCLMFPYMTPDNNSEFATNIALFHNAQYRGMEEKDRFKDLDTIRSIKNISDKSKLIAKKAEKLLKNRESDKADI